MDFPWFEKAVISTAYYFLGSGPLIELAVMTGKV